MIAEVTIRKYAKPLLLLFTALLYHHTFLNGFVLWDDPSVIEFNPVVTEPSLSRVVWLFFHSVGGTFRPVTYVVYSLTSSLFGVNAWAFHAVSLLFHLLSVLMVFNFCYYLSRRNWSIAFIAATIFAFHPMHAESVAWASALNDPVSAFFFFAALTYYTKFVLYGEKRLFWLAFLAAIIAMLSKPTAIMLPFLMLVVDWYLNKRITKEDILAKWIFYIFSGVILFTTIYARRSMHDVGGVSEMMFAGYQILYPLFALGFYLVKFLFPMGFSAQYTMPHLKYEVLPIVYYLAPFALLILAIVVWKLHYRKRDLIFGLLFFLVAILPSSQLLPFGDLIVADRYAYTAYVGLGFFVATILNDLRLSDSKFVRTISLSIFAVWLLFLSTQTLLRVYKWENTKLLFTDLVAKYEREPLAWAILSSDAYESGDVPLSEKYIANYQRIIRFPERFPSVRIMEGNLLYCRGEYEAAKEVYLTAVEQTSQYGKAWHGLGNCYLCLGDTVSACEAWHHAQSKYYPYTDELIEMYCNPSEK